MKTRHLGVEKALIDTSFEGFNKRGWSSRFNEGLQQPDSRNRKDVGIKVGRS